MRRAARTDDNQTAVVNALRGAGYSVVITSMVGDGFPDLVVGENGVTILVEVKDGAKTPSRKKLTDDQTTFFNDYRGAAIVVYSPDDAVVKMEALLKK